jgi:hypothetical protein
MFKRSVAKLSIGSLDDPDLSVEAHYNPKDLAYQRSVPWAPHPLADKAAEDQMEVEFTGAQPRTMDLELLFDSFETNDSVKDLVDALDALAAVRDPASPDPQQRRPHYCVVTWGDQGVRALRCVIESLAVKYTMFDRMGAPKRAVCNVKVREAHLQGDFDGGEGRQLAAMRRRMAARDR